MRLSVPHRPREQTYTVPGITSEPDIASGISPQAHHLQERKGRS